MQWVGYLEYGLWIDSAMRSGLLVMVMVMIFFFMSVITQEVVRLKGKRTRKAKHRA